MTSGHVLEVFVRITCDIKKRPFVLWKLFIDLCFDNDGCSLGDSFTPEDTPSLSENDRFRRGVYKRHFMKRRNKDA